MPGPYRVVKRVRCRVGARCGGGVKTPPYEGRMQWQLTQSGGPGMPGPYREVQRVSCRAGARCGGGVKTPPYEGRIQWRQP